MDSPPADQPPAKRIKLDAVAAAAAVVAASTPAPPASAPAFSFEGETGLFGLVAPSLGFRAATEPEVGILEYVDPDIPAFSGIIKHRFTDFLVYEVGLDGEVVRLKNINGPPKQPKAPKEKAPEAGEDGAAAAVEQPLWNETSEAAISLVLPSAKVEEFKAFVLEGPAPNGPKTDPPTPIRSFRSEVCYFAALQSPAPDKSPKVIEAKEARTAFHRGLRDAFAGRFSSEVKEVEGGAQVIEVTWNKPGQQKDRISKAERQNRSNTKDLPRYIHFTLQKTNKEMHDALSGLTRTLRLQGRDLGTAGTKDKRAVTVQRVSMKRGNQTIEDVWRASRGGGGGRGRGRGRGGFNAGGSERGVRIGDVEYKDYGLDLGMLKGNKFVVTLRDVEADSPQTIERAIDTIRTRGFINYYGMQRFGTAPIPTHVIGLAILRSDWALAAHLLLRPRDGEGDDVAIARIVFAEGKVSEAVRLMPRRAVAERAMLEHYDRVNPADHLGALSKIPKNLRMMYVHAWQSYIWNRVVSERVKLFGCTEPIEGDLVFVDGDGSGEGEGDAVAEEPVAAVVESLDPDLESDDPSPSAPGAPGKMNMNAALRLSKVAAVKVLTQADIDSHKYTIFDVVLPMPGFAVVYPTGKLGETYRETIKADKLDPDDLFRKQKEYSLGGAYRKIMHLPSDVTHRLLTYTSAMQDLAQSDEDALLNRAPATGTPYDPTVPLPEGHSLALQIELTLGSSTYATMALREVLKSRTSGAHQKSLTVAMESRVKEGEEVKVAVMEVDARVVESVEAAKVMESTSPGETVVAE